MKFSSYGSNSATLVLVSLAFIMGCVLGPSNSSKLEKAPAYTLPPPTGKIRILTLNVLSGLTYRGFFKMGEYKHLITILSILVFLFCVQCCAFLKYRADDFAEIVDIGITVSKKPYFALYADELSLLPAGYAHVDGHFIGWGGGQVGKTTHAVHFFGLLVHGKEELGWHRKHEGEGGAKEVEAIKAWQNREGFIEQGAGATMVIDDTVRLITGKMFEGQNQPDHSLSCLHYIHLGWFGVVVNVRTLDIIDFILGWFGIDFGRLDLGGDDGTERKWGLSPGGWRF